MASRYGPVSALPGSIELTLGFGCLLTGKHASHFGQLPLFQ